MTGRDVRLHLTLDGPFRTARFRYALATPHVAFDDTGFDGVRASGTGQLAKAPVIVPIRLSADRVTGLGDVAGGILARLAIAGSVRVDAKTLVGEGMALTSDKLRGTLGLHLDLVTGRYAVALSGGLQRYLVPGLGIIDVDSSLSAVPGAEGRGTIVSGRGKAAVRRFDNAFLASLAGGLPQLDTQLVRSADGVLHFSNLVITAPSIRITGSGMRRRDGSFQFEGMGRQATYGTFRIALDGMIDHPQIRLVLDRPVDPLGLAQVKLDLDPVADGFSFRAAGSSYLGPFGATGGIHTPPGGTTVIEVASLAVTGTRARGRLRSDPGGFTGRLDVAGGGIGGAIDFAPAGTIQRIDPHLTFTGATLTAAVPVAIKRGKLDGSILLDQAGVAIKGALTGQGMRRGAVSIARLNLGADLRAGSGNVTIAVAGSRGRAFDLRGSVALQPNRVTVAGEGTVDQKPIRLVTPAAFSADGGGWLLAPTQLTFGGGSATLGGRFAPGQLTMNAGLDRMPLSVIDIALPGLGLSGQASGKLAYASARGAGAYGAARPHDTRPKPGDASCWRRSRLMSRSPPR